MQFAYTARGMKGDTVTGSLVADSLAHAQAQLREKGLYLISYKTGAQSAVPRARRSWRSRVTKKDLMTFTSQFAVMTKAGIDVATALHSLAAQCPNLKLKKVLDAVHADVLAGKPLSGALQGHGGVFNSTYLATVAAGEASGQLPTVLGRLSTMQRAEIRFQATRRALLAYPIVLSSVAGLVILALMFFVLPQFAGVFEQFEMPLPGITQFLLAVSTQLQARWPILLGLMAASVLGIRAFLRSQRGQRLRDSWLLNARFVRDVTRAMLVGRAFRLLGMMVDSGVPLLDGLRLTRSSINNCLYRQLFDQLENDVLNGRGLSGGLITATFLPSGAAEMIATAERTGTLGTVSQVMGEFYEEEGESRLRELATIIEPLIIIIMGVVVAFVVLSVMLPLFDFATISHR